MAIKFKIAVFRVDLRKSIEGIAAIVRQNVPVNLFRTIIQRKVYRILAAGNVI